MENKVIEEQIISLETAKLANNKGFNVECDYFYNRGSNYKLQNDSIIRTGDDLIYEAPTQSLLQKWLRDLHGVDIHITRNKPSYREYRVEIYKIDNTPNYIYFQINTKKSNGCKWFDDYEEALEQGLQEALKLI